MDKNKVYRGKRANKYVKNHTQEMCDFYYDNINSGVKGYDFLDMQIYPNIKVQGNRYYKRHILRRKKRHGAYCFNYMESINEQISKSYELDLKKYVLMYQGKYVLLSGTTSHLNSLRDEARFICVDDISELSQLDFYDKVSATQMLNLYNWRKLNEKNKYISSKELSIVDIDNLEIKEEK